MSISRFLNSTVNQHFVSRAEQRLNSCSPNPQSNKAEIYKYNIKSISPPSISRNGKAAIWRNLSFHDLFTISRTKDKKRVNIEILFGSYEAEFSTRAARLLSWIDKARCTPESLSEKIDLHSVEGLNFSAAISDIKFIYKYKILVGMRNPFQIKDTLTEFSSALDHSRDSAAALGLHMALEKKNESEEAVILKEYGISRDEYRAWIRLLILFFYSETDGNTILDEFVDEFFKAKELFTNIVIGYFDENCALLPDTGVVKDAFSDGTATYMNISKHCVIAVKHTKINGQLFNKLFECHRLSECSRNELINSLASEIKGSLILNDNELLSGYNQICVKAAANQVFSASSNVVGVNVAEKD